MKALTSSELYEEVVATAELDPEGDYDSYELVRCVIEALAAVAANEISSGMPVTIPGLCRIAPSFVAAKPRREGRNFQGELVMMNAQPAKTRVRARPANAIKNAVPSPRSLAGKRLGKEAAKRSRKSRARARA